MAMVSNSSSGNTSGSTNATITFVTPTPSAFGSLPSKSAALNGADTCGCQASGVARTCYDCLNAKLLNDRSCAINPYGTCMDSTSALGYEPYFNTAYYIGTTMNYSVIRHENEFFWSKNATYCSSDDATCTGCRAKWIDAFQNQYQISDFSCVGTGGCVCTAYCELRQLTAFPAYNYSSGSETCYDRSGVVAWSNADQGSLMLVRNIATLLIGALMVVMTVRQIMIQFHQRQHERRMREQRAALRRQRDETSRFGLMLTLEGWNGYREQLIEREQETLGLKSEPLLSEAPTRAVVAEGEGFRPATPSQLTRQQRTTREG